MKEHVLATPMDLAIAAVKKGRLNQSDAARKYKVQRSTLCTMCRALDIKVNPKVARNGRPRK